MQLMTQPDLADGADVRGELARLASIGASDAAFLSCYLDARYGVDGCRGFLQRKAERIRAGLKGTARLDFENALAMIEHELERAWHPDVQGLALFARGYAGGRHLSALRLAVPVHNSMALYRVPEILPLLALLDEERRFHLLLAHRDAVQLLDVEMGVAVPRAWVSCKPVLPDDSVPAVSPGNPVSAAERRNLQTIRRLLSGGEQTPLVLGGDAAGLERLRGCLPRRAGARIEARVELPWRLGLRDAVDLVRTRLADGWRRQSSELAAHLVRSMRVRGLAVAGQLAAERALREGRVDTLVVADGHPREAAPQWDSKIELTRMACGRGVRVVLADSDELRYFGGVGCVLQTRRSAPAMPLPGRSGSLDLVA